MAELELPCPLVELVPHRPPMQLLDTLEVFTEQRGEVVGSVSADHIFLVPECGALHAAASIEILAQGAAAHEGFRRRRAGGEVGGGFLASVRDFVFRRPPRVGDELRVVAERGMAIDRLQIVRGWVRCGSEVIAEGELTFFLSDELVPQEMPQPESTDADSGPGCADDAAFAMIVPALAASRELFEADNARAVYAFPPGFPAFRGHFPSYPILPAVVSLVIAERTVNDLEGGGFELGGVKTAKFPRPILPGADVEVSCEPVLFADRRDWKVQLRVGDDLVGKMKLLAR